MSTTRSATAHALASVTPIETAFRPPRARPDLRVRPTWAEISLPSLRHNLAAMSRQTSAPVWCVLKADAYGHGARAVAVTLERAGAPGFCVALLEEAVELRDAGVRAPILVMGGYYEDGWDELLERRLIPVVYDAGQVRALAQAARYAGREAVPVHLKIDTGMARLGVTPTEVNAVTRELLRHPEIRLDGLMTHFACADAPDTASIEHQLDIFDAVTDALTAQGLRAPRRHAANSAAVLRSPRSHLDMVRAGVAIYGVPPFEDTEVALSPSLRLVSSVVALRELAPGQSAGYGGTWTARRRSRLATLPVGYADGLSRSLSSAGSVLVHGVRAPIVGTVSMDLTMIDVTDIQGVELGDECVVIGRQRGRHGEGEITATELATRMGTIPWEVLTNVSRRVPRYYREPMV